MTRTQIINELINIYGYRTYLEIGVYDSKNFNSISCVKKVSVDPDSHTRPTYRLTSDKFFETHPEKFDIIFIDGLHHDYQVIRDIDNSLLHLNEGGSIVCHDCNPTSELMQRVPRESGEWTGDVWKAWLHFRSRPDLSMHVLDTDYGVGVIRRGKQIPLIVTDPDYSGLESNRKEWLNLIDFKPAPVSICIPAFEQYGHGVKTLTLLLQSIQKQAGVEIETIVSDNSLDDNIERLCANYPVKYFKNPVLGISANTNNAISKATYDLIKPMYQDDLLIDRYAIQKISFALKFDQWVVSSGQRVNDKNRCVGRTSPAYTDKIIEGKNTIGMPSVTAWRRNEFIFDDKLKTLLDCDFYYRMKKEYGLPGLIKRELIGSRYWNGSTSHVQGNLTDQEWPYIKEKHGLL